MRSLTKFETGALAIAVAFGAASASAHAEERDSKMASRLFAHIEPCWDMVRKMRPVSASVSLAEAPQGDGTMIKLHAVDFPNFSAKYYVDPDGTMLTAALSTRSKSFELPSGLEIGQPMARVHAVLGKPTQMHSKSSVYTVGGTQSSVTFHFKSDALAQVSWAYDLH